MAFMSLDPNLSLVTQGLILIGVVMFGSLIQWRQGRR
jgi:ribose/xylose/arabinose/galactoside ABC-type transport system permease subunit